MKETGKFGFWSIVLLGINGIVGTGIFLLPNKAYSIIGSASLGVLLFDAIIAGCIALCFAEAASLFTRNGGPYLYAKHALGDFWAFEVGVLKWIVTVIAWAAMAVGFATALGAAVPALSGDFAKDVISFILIVGLTIVNIFGVNVSKFVNNFNREINKEGSYVYGSNLADSSAQMSALFGGVFFIGIFLSIIFMVGTVLVIYYKQISEGYEDRERFIILQKVGLDQKQIKQTINKQVLTVFFLPLLFAFLHLAFAYHMLSLILKVIGVLDATMMLTVTLSICAIFLIVYVLIFMITSRSYRKIVQM